MACSLGQQQHEELTQAKSLSLASFTPFGLSVWQLWLLPFGYMAETGINFSFHSLSSQSTVLASVWVSELTEFNVLVHLYPQN